MDEREKKEEKNKRIGWLTSIGVQLVLLVLFYFIVAWKEPFPPIPEYGIELGFTTSAGAPATSSPAQEAPDTEEVPEEQAVESESSEIEETESESEEVSEQSIPKSQVESPVKVEESTANETKAEVEDVKQVDNRAVMTPSETKSDKTSENPSEGGEEEKELDQRAIYGSKGTNTGDSEGANLMLAGWEWVSPPKPDDSSDVSGKIKFEITVDDEGYIISLRTIESNIPKSIEKIYEKAVLELSFVKTEGKAAPSSKGTITFIIKSR